MAEDLNDDARPERSIHSNTSTEIHFTNMSRYSVQVLWLDYQGEPVLYNILGPGSSYRQQTYVTHPWVCIELDTGRYELMKLNSCEILYPEEKPLTGLITEPDRSLYELCMISIRKSLRESFGVQVPNFLQSHHVNCLPLPVRIVEDILSYDSAPPSPLVSSYVANL